MINDLLGKVTSVIEKDFLFGSLLPSFLFLFALLMTLVANSDSSLILIYIFEQATDNPLTIATIFILILISCAYIVYMFRNTFLTFWCGKSLFFHWLFELTFLFHKSRYKRLSNLPQKSILLEQLLVNFRQIARRNVNAIVSANAPIINSNTKKRLRKLLDGVNILNDIDKAAQLLDNVAAFYGTYTTASVDDVVIPYLNKFDEWAEELAVEDQSRFARLDFEYGSVGTIAPTRLGNIVQSYNQYPFKRYSMESEIFWTRIIKVMDESFEKRINDQKLMLDFSLTCASMSLLYAACTMLIPWLSSEKESWFVLTIIGLFVSQVFYNSAITSAISFGQFVRTAYDLYRLNLLESYSMEMPANDKEERALWESISQLIVYGHTNNILKYVYKSNV
jgi:hypothetical protein